MMYRVCDWLHKIVGPTLFTTIEDISDGPFGEVYSFSGPLSAPCIKRLLPSRLSLSVFII